MTKTVLCILCLIVAVFAVLFNNLGSNAYAQEIHCPEINMLTINEEEKFFSDFVNSLGCDYDYNGYSVGVEELGSASINLEWSKSTMYETCFEYTQHWVITFDAIDSKTHYAYVYFFASWTEPYSRDSPPFLNSVQNAALDLLHQVENSELAAPCESSDFEFDIDVPVFETVKQKDTVRIPVEVTLVKGEPKQVALSTTTFQESLGIYGWFEQDLVTPTQRTYLVVQTSCNTLPDNYQFYANGVATSGSASSTDMVTVTVEPSSDCPSQNNQIGQRPIISGSISESLDTAFDLHDQGKYQEAIPYYDYVLQQEPDNLGALYSKANALENLEEYEDALEYYHKAIQIEPEEQQILEGIAHTTLQLERYEESISYYDKLLEKDPDHLNALWGKGAALSNSGKYQESLLYFDKALEIDPENAILQQNKKLTIEKIEMQESNESGGGCLIATATFGSEIAPQVQFLREIRDNTVLSTASGTSFMTAFNAFYYSFSPTVADLERQNPVFKELVKVTITPLLSSLSLLQYVDIDSEAEMLYYGIGIILLNIGMYFVVPAFVIIRIKQYKNNFFTKVDPKHTHDIFRKQDEFQP